jgi:hypothetical protein
VTTPATPSSRFAAVRSSRLPLWAAFVVVHLVLGLVNLYSSSNPMGDVRFVYSFWVDQALSTQYWVGIDGPWVYPILAFLPMFAARIFGSEFYASTWLSLVMALDAVALATLTGWGRRSRNLAAGWWWVLFVALLGPIALSRLDSITVAVAIVGVLFVARRPRVASVLLTLAAWIKVWPAAIVASLVIASRHRGLVVASAASTSLVIVVIALAFGSGLNVFSFVTEQTGRGLQIEAPVSTIWLWRAFAGVPGTRVYYDHDILTYQVAGPGTDVASALMNPMMLAAVVLVVALAVRAVRRGRSAVELVPILSLALVAALVAFNKVGSPQYIGWFAVPVIAGLATGGIARASMRTPARLVLVIAALTQVVYPYFYVSLLALEPWMLVVLSARNLLVVALLGITVVELAALGRRGAVSGGAAERVRLDGVPGPKDPVS